MTLQHIVLFSFPADLSAADALDMRAQITAWPQLIGGIDVIRFGSDPAGTRTRGHQYLLYTEFEDEVALRSYQQHPVHQAFLRWTLDRDCTPLAFDYPLDGHTLIWPHDPAEANEEKSWA